MEVVEALGRLPLATQLGAVAVLAALPPHKPCEEEDECSETDRRGPVIIERSFLKNHNNSTKWAFGFLVAAFPKLLLQKPKPTAVFSKATVQPTP